ncbi:hypothetical protein SNEBB_003372 [Seison nebaliae]|nr:hypothetical protein SNEBB_003372 [Seison nebaliae]
MTKKKNLDNENVIHSQKNSSIVYTHKNRSPISISNFTFSKLPKNNFSQFSPNKSDEQLPLATYKEYDADLPSSMTTITYPTTTNKTKFPKNIEPLNLNKFNNNQYLENANHSFNNSNSHFNDSNVLPGSVKSRANLWDKLICQSSDADSSDSSSCLPVSSKLTPHDEEINDYEYTRMQEELNHRVWQREFEQFT